MSEQALVPHEATETALAPAAPKSMLEIIHAVAVDSRVDVDKLKAILDMQFQIEARDAKKRFDDAVSRVQTEAPQLSKSKSITVKGQERSRYAPLEDIDVILRPLLREEGLSWRVSEQACTESGMVAFALKVSGHGHSEEIIRTFPTDKAAVGQYGPVRSAIQDAGSTTSYATRYLLKMFFGLVETGVDNDGNDTKTITPDQAKDLDVMLTDLEADKAAFLSYMKAPSLEAILERDLKAAMTAIDSKRRAKEAQKR